MPAFCVPISVFVSAILQLYPPQSGTKYSQVKRNHFFREARSLPKKKKERMTMSNNSSNRINIPEAKQAMDQFKMQAARWSRR